MRIDPDIHRMRENQSCQILPHLFGFPMLIEFSISNFRSIGAEQTLSLVASKLKEKSTGREVAVPGFDIKLLTSVIVLGKNGGGKSNLIAAMATLRKMVENSAKSDAKDKIEWHPNRLVSTLRDKDTSFRILFSYKETIYQYELSFNSEKITEEKLSSLKKSKRFKNIFSRKLQGKSYRYIFGNELKGNKIVWKNATTDNSLYLSTANFLNSKSLRDPYVWITEYFQMYDSSHPATGYTTKQCTSEKNSEVVAKFLSKLDLGIKRIDVKESDFDTSALNDLMKPELFSEFINKAGELKEREVAFIRTGDDGSDVPMTPNDESTGTNALFGLAGPLFDTLQNGYCVVIDEINTSIHPLIVHTLIDIFSNPDLNRKRAQIVFTSHDTSLLRDHYFRRDQVWFVDKSQHGETSLTPLTDFSPRKDEALEKGYLTGRYGGVPYVGEVVRAFEKSEELWREIP